MQSKQDFQRSSWPGFKEYILTQDPRSNSVQYSIIEPFWKSSYLVPTWYSWHWKFFFSDKKLQTSHKSIQEPRLCQFSACWQWKVNWGEPRKCLRPCLVLQELHCRKSPELQLHLEKQSSSRMESQGNGSERCTETPKGLRALNSGQKHPIICWGRADSEVGTSPGYSRSERHYFTLEQVSSEPPGAAAQLSSGMAGELSCWNASQGAQQAQHLTGCTGCCSCRDRLCFSWGTACF